MPPAPDERPAGWQGGGLRVLHEVCPRCNTYLWQDQTGIWCPGCAWCQQCQGQGCPQCRDLPPTKVASWYHGPPAAALPPGVLGAPTPVACRTCQHPMRRLATDAAIPLVVWACEPCVQLCVANYKHLAYGWFRWEGATPGP